MIFGLLSSLFTLACILLILVILVQKGKGSMGLGNLGGGAQMLFGGSGGQDFFQKLTWILGAIILLGSLGLALLKVKNLHESRPKQYKAPIHIPQPKRPTSTEEAYAHSNINK